ncbi:MAG: hypothetical protein QM770_00825 [Tepidisphaeraceae bacterium]
MGFSCPTCLLGLLAMTFVIAGLVWVWLRVGSPLPVGTPSRLAMASLVTLVPVVGVGPVAVVRRWLARSARRTADADAPETPSTLDVNIRVDNPSWVLARL